MRQIYGQYVAPSVDLRAFNCPHCHAFAKQVRYSAHGKSLEKDATPTSKSPVFEELASEENVETRDQDSTAKFEGIMAIEYSGHGLFDSPSCDLGLRNLYFSRCFNCNDVAIWISDRLVWPRRGEAPLPNVDLPDNVKRDYEEANTIVDLSPRGAAALLRLSIQKLCKTLGGKGRSIDDDISALVKKGLDVRAQQALDVVRVIGNNAVHPGQIDLRDDRATAQKLFGLVNLVADLMISQPKHIEEMFKSLPENALKAIERRDKQKSSDS